MIEYRELSQSFCDWLYFTEVAQTSWAEWRYWDNPEYWAMLCMGGEL